jgi:hypothetical protein
MRQFIARFLAVRVAIWPRISYFNALRNLSARVRQQAKPGQVVLVNGKRHRGATNLPLARSGRTHLSKFAS